MPGMDRWEDLSDDELSARLLHRGCLNVARLIRDRDDEATTELIGRLLDDKERNR